MVSRDCKGRSACGAENQCLRVDAFPSGLLVGYQRHCEVSSKKPRCRSLDSRYPFKFFVPPYRIRPLEKLTGEYNILILEVADLSLALYSLLLRV